MALYEQHPNFLLVASLRIYLVDPFFPYHAALTRSIESEFAKHTILYFQGSTSLVNITTFLESEVSYQVSHHQPTCDAFRITIE